MTLRELLTELQKFGQRFDDYTIVLRCDDLASFLALTRMEAEADTKRIVLEGRKYRL